MDNNIIDKRTKGKWEVIELPETNTLYVSSKINGAICLIPADSKHIEEHKANAAFIVKACNNYDSLLEALKKVNNWLNSDNDMEATIYDVVKEAIKKAEQS